MYGTRGDLEQAEQMHRKALGIEERLRRLEGMAAWYRDLGLIYQRRGDLEQDREYWTKAAELFRKIGMPHMVEEVQGRLAELESKDRD